MYLRLKFTAATNHMDSAVQGQPISQWIQQVLSGSITTSQLPATVFDLSNCVRFGSLPTTVTVSFQNTASTNSQTRQDGCYLQFQKAHSQNANFVNLFRIYQNGLNNQSWQPRLLSSNGTNSRPSAVDTGQFWYNTQNTAYPTHGLSNGEMQFFISTHWVIWNFIDGSGRGGTAGIYDVESTGQDVWARTLNSLYSPQIFITSHGAVWPTSSTLRAAEASNERNQLGIYSNLMYNGDSTFTNQGSLQQGHYSFGRDQIQPTLYPNPNSAFYPTRDNIGDTQNYMMPVYFYANDHQSNTIPSRRALLNGRVPFLWRTSDNAAQTGQAATVGGVEYRFVRLHPCGSTGTTDINAATYMVPTLIGGI
jgi:hypothetical protein